jgi:hypothetical protein
MPWVESHQRRTLLYRYAGRGFATGSNNSSTDYLDQESAEEWTPLARAILEPAHINGRPDIATLVVEEEKQQKQQKS